IYNPNGQFESLNQGETATDTFTYTINDGNGLTDTATVSVTINGANENPVLANNNGLTLDEDAALSITSSQLQVTDVDNNASQITYQLTDTTDNGSLLLNGNQINLNNTFTQADIDNNRLSYDHNGSETTSDSFTFEVIDGAGGSINSQTFDITVNPREILGTSGRDTLTGNSGDNIITGSRGADMLTGGSGDDQFIYTSLTDREDIITDFEVGSDKIVLTQLLDRINYRGSDAIGDGYVNLGSNSQGDAFVQIDINGRRRSCFAPITLVVMEGVTLENLSANADNSFVF
ncbi:MAG: cadherin-like domain-containing protein, partial [Cyanobacteria bacterium P01_A01_bin.80]